MSFLPQDLLSNIGDFLVATYVIAAQVQNLGLASLILLFFFFYLRAPAIFYVPVLAFYFSGFDLGHVFWSFFAVTAATLSIPLLRRYLLSNLVVIFIKRLGLLPKISQTEKIALTSGTVWVDGQIFSGDPDMEWIFAQKYPKLTQEEQDFLDNQVETVCKMCSDYEIQVQKDLPQEVWQYLKDNKFFGMIIPKSFGGLGFSAYAHSCVVEKLASHSAPLAITVMVPNSLGPAELLLHYGTKSQQEYYLPRLSDGREIPCFALTETGAGSDATSIESSGELFRDSSGEVKIKLNWRKRYITLGAVATTIGIAFRLYDPDRVLFDHEDVGITCALIPHEAEGVIQGRRHDPLATPFINSPLDGRDVIVGLDAVIGDKSGLGQGWKMLMESLSAGRGISLPSTSSGGAKLVARATSAYTAIRQQFGAPISKFEGVEEVLSRIASNTYTIDALRKFTVGAVDSGAKPAVITAIAKYHGTELFRKTINDGMDVMGGRAIIRGPRNVLANAYFSAPISITVEGANIVTRTLIQFGQGAIMCHPYAYKEIQALENGDIKAFDRAFFGHVRHLLCNFSRSVIYSLSRGLIISAPSKHRKVAKYQRKISWASATFAFLADIALAKFGGNLKRKEKLNGRFADVLSNLYMAICVLKKFEEEGCKKEDLALMELSVKTLLLQAQNAFDGIYHNLFSGIFALIIKPFAFFTKLNALTCPPSDDLGRKSVKDFAKDGDFRENLTAGIFVNHQDPEDNLGRLENALKWHESSLESIKDIKNAMKKGILPKKKLEDVLDQAKKHAIIDEAKRKHIIQTLLTVKDAMEVDEYSLDDYKNT